MRFTYVGVIGEFQVSRDHMEFHVSHVSLQIDSSDLSVLAIVKSVNIMMIINRQGNMYGIGEAWNHMCRQG